MSKRKGEKSPKLNCDEKSNKIIVMKTHSLVEYDQNWELKNGGYQDKYLDQQIGF